MAGKVRYLIQRNGRYHARIVVPLSIRKWVGKVELSAALGPDRKAAIRALPKVVAGFQDELAAAARRAQPESLGASSIAIKATWTPIGAARQHYLDAIAFDAELRDSTPRYARHGFIDEQYVSSLKAIAAGSADETETIRTLRVVLGKFGATDPTLPDWRQLTRKLAQAELAALEVSALRDEGEPDPPIPAFLAVKVAPLTQNTGTPIPIRDIFRGYREELQIIGKGRGAESRWSPVIENLIRFIGRDDAAGLKRQDVLRWKDELSKSFAPKTVRDFYLATARAAFGWAVDNLRVAENPFVGVKVRLAKRTSSREKGFSEPEAVAILKSSGSYVGSKREHASMTAAKRWTPILAAYSGARIGELVQLRAEDVRKDGAVDFIRIAPEAGTVKSGLYRDVPLHNHIVDSGFLDFVRSVGTGPLFYKPSSRPSKSLPGSVVAGRLAKWIRSLDVADTAVQPNHGWRHRMKTVGRELGLDPRVLDAIQGHAARTAGEDYGDVTLKAKQAAIQRLPRYQIT
jgi:integrase